MGLFGGGTQVVPIPMDDDETELLREVATVHPGTLSSIPGDLVLTSSRLVFAPVQGKKAPQLITWRFTKGKSRTKAPDALAAARAKSAPGLMRPPTLVLTTGDGTTWEIGILAGRRKPNRSPDNARARDRLVEAIQGRLAD
ncbi:hypothetical protein [Petropleomorpha daqingensis]|uniref:GRAM domain-containing protein n=1 Tax=Petropleomorpha daqingensis TaxID=2026353 RepID=A0A853CDQ5_9ACTN|nr:hypothetical protein [Petropleomorpha daqingensis]NYJ04273.1 hypothetical protein [Petropleomorpha daqingensis]